LQNEKEEYLNEPVGGKTRRIDPPVQCPLLAKADILPARPSVANDVVDRGRSRQRVPIG
jgi:hypothetical protein